MMEGILIFIFAACLHFRQIPGKDVQMTSFLSSPGALSPVQLGTETCLVMCLSFSSGGWGWGTRQERPLHREALKDCCFLRGSLLPEQRGKLGHNFMSHRTTVLSEHRKWTWLLRWSRGSKLYKGFEGNASGGSHPPATLLRRKEEKKWVCLPLMPRSCDVILSIPSIAPSSSARDRINRLSTWSCTECLVGLLGLFLLASFFFNERMNLTLLAVMINQNFLARLE